jgi:hypothetical protein
MGLQVITVNYFPRQSTFHAGPRIFRRLFPAQKHNDANASFRELTPETVILVPSNTVANPLNQNILLDSED